VLFFVVLYLVICGSIVILCFVYFPILATWRKDLLVAQSRVVSRAGITGRVRAKVW